MPNYLICYDVRSKNHDYTALYAALAKAGAAHLQNSVWLADIKGPAAGVRDELRAHMHPDDTIAVIRLPSNSYAQTDWATRHDRVTGVNWLRAHYG